MSRLAANAVQPCVPMRFVSTAKALAKCKLKYYRTSECASQVLMMIPPTVAYFAQVISGHQRASEPGMIRAASNTSRC